MVTRMLLKLRPDVSCTTSGCIFPCVGTYLMLRRDAISTASGEILREKAMKSTNMQTIAQIVCLIYIIFAHTYWNKSYLCNK